MTLVRMKPNVLKAVDDAIINAMSRKIEDDS